MAEFRPVQLAAHVDDERIIELAWNKEKGQPDFILYNRKEHTVARTNSVDSPIGNIVLPPWGGVVTPDSSIPGSVFMPTECDLAHADGDRLREDIRAFINRYVELPGEAISLAVEYVLFSWVHDAFDELPYLAFRSPDYGCGKSRALETVGTLCYRPVFVGGGSTAAAILRIIDQFKGTLVGDEFDHKRDTELASVLTKILNQGFQRNRPLLKCVGDNHQPRAFHCFGPKVIVSRRPFGDAAAESRMLVVRMKPRTRSDIQLNLFRRQFDAEALALRNRLLAWRFSNLDRVSIDPALAVPGLEDRLNQIGLPLLSVAQKPEICERIAISLRAQQHEIAAELSEALPGQVFQLLLQEYDLGGVVAPKAVATKFNARDVPFWPSHWLTPERMGRILKHDLGLPRAPRDRQGVRYELNPDRMRQLASKFGVPVKEPAQRPARPAQESVEEPAPPTQEPASATECHQMPSRD